MTICPMSTDRGGRARPRQFASEDIQSLIESRLYGAQRTPDQIGNFLERQAVILLQHDGRALFLRQKRHRPLHRPSKVAPRHTVLDGLRRLTRRGQIHQIDVLGRLDDRRPPLPPKPVPTEIEGDAIEPRRELRLTAKTLQGAVGSEERFLADVPRVFFATDLTICEGVNRAFPSLDELVEAVLVAANRSGDELFVRPRHAERGRPFLWRT